MDEIFDGLGKLVEVHKQLSLNFISLHFTDMGLPEAGAQDLCLQCEQFPAFVRTMLKEEERASTREGALLSSDSGYRAYVSLGIIPHCD